MTLRGLIRLSAGLFTVLLLITGPVQTVHAIESVIDEDDSDEPDILDGGSSHVITTPIKSPAKTISAG